MVMSVICDTKKEDIPSEADAGSVEWINKTIVSCVDRGMRMLGESGKYAVYHIMKSEFSLPSERIAEDPQMFVSALDHIFGLGSRILEESVLEELYMTACHNKESRARVADFACVLEVELRRSPQSAYRDISRSPGQ